jgi:putative hydrolase of the HAD superfamily
MEFKTIIFDLFGTLVENLLSHQYREILVEITGVLATEPDRFIDAWLGYSDERMTGKMTNTDCLWLICQKTGLETSEEQHKNCMRVFHHHVKLRLEPPVATITTLAKLREKGYQIGMISNCSDEVSLFWDDSPLSNIIRDPIFSSSAGMKKPDPEIFLLAAEKMHVRPWECLFIDDSVEYLRGAGEAGMTGVLIQDGTLNSSSSNADAWDGHMISSIRDIEVLIDSM